MADLTDKDREKLVDDLHTAARAYIQGNGGDVWMIGPIELLAQKPTAFDLVIKCVGRRPEHLA